jgi:hypothetical protein
MGVWERKGKHYDVGEPAELSKLSQTMTGRGSFVLRFAGAVFKLKFDESPYHNGLRLDAALVGVWRVVDMADSDGVPGLHATRNDLSFKASRILVADADLQDRMDALHREGRRSLVAELLEKAEKAVRPAVHQ